MSGLFVTGTDTGVGKTLVACALVRLLRERGIDAVGFKPVVTGIENGRWEDTEALFEASGGCEPREKISPLRYAAPLAPVQAAKLEGVEPDLGLAQSAWQYLAQRHSCIVAEGVGGLMVPLNSKLVVLDFIKTLKYPAVLVARAALGTVNHTLLSLQTLEHAHIPVAALILNITHPKDASNVQPSITEIERHSPHRVVGVLPYFDGGNSVPAVSLGNKIQKAKEILSKIENIDQIIGT